MYAFSIRAGLVVTSAALLLLAACSPSDSPGQAQNVDTGEDAETTTAQIKAPAGQYKVDHNHATLAFSVSHVGLSNYIAPFTQYDVTLDLDPDNYAQSSVKVDIDAGSVDPDYAGDYQATHPDSKFKSWQQDLARSDKFFNADEFPRITFQSTKVEKTGPGQMRVTGDLTLLGQTRPVTMDARVVGSTANHPAYPEVGGAIGFSARGTFKRSDFGMDYLVNPPLIGDEVTLLFEGEFQKIKQETPAPAG